MLFKYLRINRIYLKHYILLITLGIILICSKNLIKKISPTKISSEWRDLFEKHIQKYEKEMIPNLGQNGEPAYLEEMQVQTGKNALKTFAANTILSNKIPLDRQLQDPRHSK